MKEIHIAAKELTDLMARIKSSGTPPHTDYWHQSIFEAEEKLINAVLEAVK